MKLLSQTVKELKFIKSSILYFLFCFIVAPIIIGLLFGTLYEKMMDKSITLNNIDVYTIIEKDDNYTEGINSMLSLKELPFINVITKKDESFIDTLKDKKDSLFIKESNNLVEIINYGKESMEKSIVSNLVTELVNVLQEKDISNMSYEEKRVFLSEFIKISGKDFTETVEIETDKKLSSYETMIVNLFVAMSLFIAVTFASEFIKDRENSMLTRLISMKVDRKSIFLNNVLSVFIIAFGITFIYMIISCMLVMRMAISPVKIILPCLIHGGFIAGIYGVSIGIFKREHTYKNIITVILMLIMILGGSSFPIDTFDNVILVAKVMPNYNIQRIFQEVLLQNDLSNVKISILIVLIEIAVLICLGLISFSYCERRKKNVKYSIS
ncbi:ABC transporter permease [Oceanirhabdus sp. W0125-5]|uniref:ABC transporter permease n=1 Tax=Oceanirhabdus sp. W0125-5 TaxID=2999116 RepID=UPI0022F2DE6E|nr:ABC transporter permease [Oceanirhabdus sp. W0125-5]WBW97176.1 ABC transporter permease [Oceanirhabdus sp. W0125-5]